ncbi:MAG: hypothetical protein PWP27_403 [Clostridiales bacterium]|jgi:hypothetical protein|nr:hypothetical protein [Clostridiales bacterium]MDK2932593.1 hypothetical protein [Clostridiales bacterium]
MSKEYYIIPVFVPHKGCPYDCIFCNQKKITGTEKDVTAKQIVKKIQTFIKTIPNKSANIEVAFYGGSFTGIPIDKQNELLSAAHSFKEKKMIQGIRISTRPDYINVQILKNLKDFDVTTIELGVQSMANEVLHLSSRGHSREDVIRASAMIRKFNISLGLQMMIGLPGDTLEKMFYTANEIIKLKPDVVRIYPTLVIKHTALETLYSRKLYKPLSLDEAIQICKTLLIMFESEDIEVIRIGLQPTENILQGKDVIAGPFHPAFRELVESEIRLDMMKWAISQFRKIPRQIKIYTNPKAISEVIARKRKNIDYLKDKFNFSKVEIIQDINLLRDEIIVSSAEESHAVNKKFFLRLMKNSRNFIENIE